MEQTSNRLVLSNERPLSPTSSNSSRLTQRWSESMLSAVETGSVSSQYLPSETFTAPVLPTFEPIREKLSRPLDDDDDDDDLLVTSGDLENSTNTIGLFDVVKREFRCKTAVITNKAAYEDPSVSLSPRKPKVNFIQVIFFKTFSKKVTLKLIMTIRDQNITKSKITLPEFDTSLNQ